MGTKRPCWLNLKRILWKPLLLLWYYKVGRHLVLMRYNNRFNIIPGVYSPPSVLACFLYVGVLSQGTVIGVVKKQLLLSTFTAIGIGEVMLMLMGVLLQPKQEYMS